MADIIPKGSFYNSNYTGGAIDEAVAQTKANKTDIEGIKTAINNKLDKPSDLDTTYKIVITNNSSTETLGYANASTPSTVMQRDTNGKAQVVDGIEGNDIVNLSQLETKAEKRYEHKFVAGNSENPTQILTFYVYNNNPNKMVVAGNYDPINPDKIIYEGSDINHSLYVESGQLQPDGLGGISYMIAGPIVGISLTGDPSTTNAYTLVNVQERSLAAGFTETITEL